MFYFENHVYKSDFLDLPSVGHGFSTREGGVSTLPHTKTMNLSFGLGDTDGEVLENMERLCSFCGVSFEGLTGSPQFHSKVVRYVTADEAGEGVTRENTAPSDGFVTDVPGVSLIIRMADCTPILFAGEKEDGSPVVSAVHAGWKGTAAGIAGVAVDKMVSLGVPAEKIKAAIGQCIRKCHFEVKEDFIASVTDMAGSGFAARHIEKRDGKYFCDITGMNIEILTEHGVLRENIDLSPLCTVCDPEKFHSHRASKGKRGTMGAVIGIRKGTRTRGNF